MIRWGKEKARQLLAERNIEMEEVARIIDKEEFLDIVKVVNQQGHPGQRMFIIMLNGYAHCVPFVIDDAGDVFIKTVFPSRLMQKKYGDGCDE